MAAGRSSAGKALELLTLVIGAPEAPLRTLAAQLGLPSSTAHRLVDSLGASGFLVREQRGRYAAGPALLAMVQAIDLNATIARLSRPPLRALARTLGTTLHLGVMEGQMVTYLVKQSAGPDQLFTREGMQLEAYCSGLGKVLLAYSTAEYREAYLSEGPFIRLTAATKIAPAELRDELDQVRRQGYAIDDGEVTEGLVCLAAPIFGWGGRVRAAISVSAPAARWADLSRDRVLHSLRLCAADIQSSLTWPGEAFGRAASGSSHPVIGNPDQLID